VQRCFKDTVHVGLIRHTTSQYLLALLDQQRTNRIYLQCLQTAKESKPLSWVLL